MQDSRKLALTAVIITMNEEVNIGRTLKAVVDLVEEVIVVDGGSTDKTKEICSSYNVRFLEHEWEGYGATKNWGIDQSTNDMILSIDADEVISEPLAASIRDCMIDRKYDAYYVNEMTNYCGTWIRHGGWYPDYHIRLFDRRKFRWNQDEVHEKLEYKPDCKLGKIKGDILHYSYVDIQDHLHRIEKYSDLGAQKLHRLGKKAGIVKRYLSPAWRFVNTYIIRMGFLDGGAGFTIARLSAYETWLKYDKLNRFE